MKNIWFHRNPKKRFHPWYHHNKWHQLQLWTIKSNSRHKITSSAPKGASSPSSVPKNPNKTRIITREPQSTINRNWFPEKKVKSIIETQGTQKTSDTSKNYNEATPTPTPKKVFNILMVRLVGKEQPDFSTKHKMIDARDQDKKILRGETQL